MYVNDCSCLKYWNFDDGGRLFWDADTPRILYEVFNAKESSKWLCKVSEILLPADSNINNIYFNQKGETETAS